MQLDGDASRNVGALLLECRHFLECAATGVDPVSNAAEATQVLAVLDACQRSLATGQKVEVQRIETSLIS